MRIVSRNKLPPDYEEMMKTEAHHNHKIIEDKHGTLRWEADPFIYKLTNDCSLNDIVIGFHSKGNNKNTETYRELYRRMGYSLSGYWEVFYWEVNNEDACSYNPPKAAI